jgi:hypothetical protein
MNSKTPQNRESETYMAGAQAPTETQTLAKSAYGVQSNETVAVTANGGAVDESEHQKAAIRKLGAALLVAVDEAMEISHERRAVRFPNVDEILEELPTDVSRAEVELALAALVDFGLLDTDTCEDCGEVKYFRICGAGTPVVLHDLY